MSPGLCDPTVSLATFEKHLKTFLNNDFLLNSTRWQYLLFKELFLDDIHCTRLCGVNMKWRVTKVC